MFKKMNDLEKSMSTLLNHINASGTIPPIPYGSDESIALHQCLENGYIENLAEWKDGNGNYHFDTLGHVHLNQKGLEFLRYMSRGFRIKNTVFDVLKGTFGFLLGILSTVTAEIIIWIIKQMLKKP